MVWCSAIRAGYSTAMGLLAQERAEGRLNVSPVLAFAGAEWLPRTELERIESAFRCPLREVYGATEFLYAAIGCAHGWLHANTDWVVLEPVDEEYRPVSPGEPSHTVLLTNLANRVQPIIRYDLGDSVTLRPDPCPCGSPLPAIRVQGRTNDVLTFDGSAGHPREAIAARARRGDRGDARRSALPGDKGCPEDAEGEARNGSRRRPREGVGRGGTSVGGVPLGTGGGPRRNRARPGATPRRSQEREVPPRLGGGVSFGNM